MISTRPLCSETETKTLQERDQDSFRDTAFDIVYLFQIQYTNLYHGHAASSLLGLSL